ncbi:MAG: hypothetical protein M3314_02425 [Actinomycetota bacterium]|nr:hypothetical protein [Actinomycetota bacterium]
MYVAVYHTIKDPASFQTRGQQLRDSSPEGLAALQFAPAMNGLRAACLWEGTSVDAVRDHIDNCLGDASDQEYFAVAEQHGFGLPATPRN